MDVQSDPRKTTFTEEATLRMDINIKPGPRRFLCHM